jgi:hypothetical protein
MSYSDGLQDYVDVAERIRQLFDKYPDASIQTNFEGMQEIAGQSYLIVKATVYRTPEDTKPGIDYAWELVPGRTPFTKGSELMVGSTSATGRAISMLGIATKRSIATKQEIQAAKSRQGDFTPEYEPVKAKPANGQPFSIPQMTKKQSDFILKLANGQIHLIQEWKASKAINDKTLNIEQAKELIEYLKELPSQDPWAAEIPRGGHDEQ